MSNSRKIRSSAILTIWSYNAGWTETLSSAHLDITSETFERSTLSQRLEI